MPSGLPPQIFQPGGLDFLTEYPAREFGPHGSDDDAPRTLLDQGETPRFTHLHAFDKPGKKVQRHIYAGDSRKFAGSSLDFAGDGDGQVARQGSGRRRQEPVSDSEMAPAVYQERRDMSIPAFIVRRGSEVT